jgi:cytochrome c biogenesis protein CcmG, thiol:disulfide interchange protein DsbE
MRRAIVTGAFGLVVALGLAACTSADGGVAGDRVSAPASESAEQSSSTTTSPRDPGLAPLVIAAGLQPCPDTVADTPVIEPVGRVGGGLPDLTFACLGEGPDVTLSGLRGTPVLLNVWASWCPPCIAEMPMLAAAARDYEDELIVLGIDMQDQPGAALDLAAVLDIGFASVVDQPGQVRGPLAIPGPPVTFFIDEFGVIQGRKDGAFPTEADLADALFQYLDIGSGSTSGGAAS